MTLICYLKNFISLLYPALCTGCRRPLYAHETFICTYCWYHLPLTNFHIDPNNAAAKQLWGRVKLERVTSMLYFIEDTSVQRILHHLKYFSKPGLGEVLGAKYAEMLKDTDFSQVDLLIPVPLHPRKLKQRGYNQSMHLAKGLHQALGIPLITDNLIRHTLAESQTTKKRYERYENMRTIFEVKDPVAIQGRHVLLVDDVLTTGATVEACANKLLEIPDVRVSVLTLAYTK